MSIGPTPPPSRPPRATTAPARDASAPPHEAAAQKKTFLRIMSEGPREHRAGEETARTLAPAATGRSVTAGLAAVSGGSAPAGLRLMAERAVDAEKKVDALVAAAASGKTFSAGELLALQATVFRYSQTIEVLSRATDRLVGSIKQVLGTQV